MGWRFRKSIKLLPGVRLNVSKRGIGYSVGGPGVRLSRSATGRYSRSLSVPGTGLTHVKRLGLRTRDTDMAQQPPSNFSQMPSGFTPIPPPPPKASAASAGLGWMKRHPKASVVGGLVALGLFASAGGEEEKPQPLAARAAATDVTAPRDQQEPAKDEAATAEAAADKAAADKAAADKAAADKAAAAKVAADKAVADKAAADKAAAAKVAADKAAAERAAADKAAADKAAAAQVAADKAAADKAAAEEAAADKAAAQQVAAAPPAAGAREYANCTELRKDYPGGVARPGAVNQGGATKYKPHYDNALYEANTKSDRDNDDIACEA